MLNQHDFDRINKHIIAKLNAYFGKKLDDEVVDGFVEDLSQFNDKVLQQAFVKIRQTSKKSPTLAEIIAVCREFEDRTSSPASSLSFSDRTSKQTVYGTAKAEDIHPETVHKILASPEGQKALELGVSSSLMVVYERTGQTEFTMDFVNNQHKKFMEGLAEIANVNKFYPPLAKMLTQLSETMKAREQRLYDKYFGKRIGL